MIAIREEKTLRLVFSCYKCTLEIKLNTKWQMTIVLTKKDDGVNGIVLLTMLRWVENFKPCD